MCEGEVLPSIHQYHLSEQVSQNFTKNICLFSLKRITIFLDNEQQPAGTFPIHTQGVTG